MTTSAASAVPVRAIAFLALAAFASAAALRVTDALLPQIAREFAVTTGTASHVVTAFAVSYGLLQIVFGPLAERHGKYLVVTFATFAASAGMIACALAGSLEALTAARFVSGAFIGALIPISLAYIGDVVPYAQRQPVLARFLTGQMLGLVGGQVLGGLLGEHFGWRVPFYVLAALCFATAACLATELRRNPVTLGARRGGAGGLFGNVRRIVSRPWPRVVLATAFCEGLAVYGPFAFIAAYLHDRFGLSLAAAGGAVACFAAGGIAYALAAPRLLARLRERGLVLVAGGANFAAYALLAFAPAAWFAVPACVALGAGFYMMHNTVQTNATQMAPEARGVGMAMFATCFFTGQSVGVAAAAVALDRVGPAPVFLTGAVALAALAFWFRARLARHAALGER
jgi:predicted MFS family arabinose efflux permease